MKLAIIGFGHAGRMHFEAMRTAFDIEPVAVCDQAPQSRATAHSLGMRAYARPSELIAHETIDAAVVCTPPHDHVAAALVLLGQGVHVLCEKPMTLRAKETLALFEAAGDHTLLAVASKFRHVPELRRLRTMILNGELGDPIGFNVKFHSVADMSSRWHAQPERSGGGVIADNGPHAFDIITYLFGDIVGLQAVELPAKQDLPVEDAAWLEIELASGVVGTAELSWSEAPSSDEYLTLQFSRAAVAVGWKRSLIKRRGSQWSVLGGPYDRNKAHCDMHNAFRAALYDGRDLWITPSECVQVVSAIEASYRSLRSGRKEPISFAAIRSLGADPAERCGQAVP